MVRDEIICKLKQGIDKAIDGKPNKECIKILTDTADHIVSLLTSFGVDY